MSTVRFLPPEEFRKANDARMALGKQRGADPEWLKANNATYGWARLDEITGPCVMWFVPWYFDPKAPEDVLERESAMQAINSGTFDKSHQYLSIHYWRDWSHIRAPLCVLCPNGAEWCVDACSSNGDGWKVTGEPPLITAQPSILVPGYHGFLNNGVFSPPL